MPYRTINKSDFPGMADTTVATPVNAGHSSALFGEKPADTTCGCCGTECCTERCYPYINNLFPGNCTGAVGENPLPSTLTVDVSTDSQHGCFVMSTIVTAIANGRWGLGRLTGSCQFCCPTDSTATCTWTFDHTVIVQCAVGGGWIVEWDHVGSSGPADIALPNDTVTLMTKHSCDPILLTGVHCIVNGLSCVVFPAVPPQPPIQHRPCLSITVYETP